MRPKTSMAAELLSALLLVAAGWGPCPLSGQVVTGRILDGQSREPIMLAELALVDSLGTVYDQTVSNHDGAFQLVADRPGEYYVLARALGYRTTLDGLLVLGEGGHIPIAFYVRRQPIELEGVTVTAGRRRTEARLASQGFYRREAEGFGHFLTPEELETAAILNMWELLRRFPGVYARSTPMGPGLFFRGGTGTGYCTPQVYVDGFRAEGATDAPGARIDEIVDVQDVVGVEVYTRISSVPLQYSVLNTCGVILIWTK